MSNKNKKLEVNEESLGLSVESVDPVSSGFKMGEEAFKALQVIIGKFPSASLRVRKDIKEKYESLMIAQRQYLDYAKSFTGRYPDVLMGLHSIVDERRRDYENSLVIFANEVSGHESDN